MLRSEVIHVLYYVLLKIIMLQNVDYLMDGLHDYPRVDYTEIYSTIIWSCRQIKILYNYEEKRKRKNKNTKEKKYKIEITYIYVFIQNKIK